jgi:hypothetical protein
MHIKPLPDVMILKSQHRAMTIPPAKAARQRLQVELEAERIPTMAIDSCDSCERER